MNLEGGVSLLWSWGKGREREGFEVMGERKERLGVARVEVERRRKVSRERGREGIGSGGTRCGSMTMVVRNEKGGMSR